MPPCEALMDARFDTVATNTHVLEEPREGTETQRTDVRASQAYGLRSCDAIRQQKKNHWNEFLADNVLYKILDRAHTQMSGRNIAPYDA